MIYCDLAIVGAGTAGCFLAEQLSQQGYRVALVEKSRGVGGRCSRRGLPDEQSVDLGAFSFRHNSGLLTPDLQRWQQQGVLRPWHHSAATLESPEALRRDTQWCGVPSMNSWHRKLCTQARVITGVKVEKLARREGHWLLLDAEGCAPVQASSVVVTTPARQALSLYPWDNEWLALIRMASERTLSQWVCALLTDRTNPQLADRYSGSDPLLAEAIRDSSKPGRDSKDSELWMLHGQSGWSASHLQLQPEEAGQQLLERFQQLLSPRGNLQLLSSHRWLLARHRGPGVAAGHLFNHQLQLALCGDWLVDDPHIDGVEAALLSAQSLTRSILNPSHSGCAA
ncbi:NAD(P)/FAD-dependent oxidoreductase [Aestuariirhabdus litorea]|uniref:FAD-dependent oxidoreductase n=1 Tax=Aestuariirhabdus litorea TaxID=2528527 RepID=A0A3P3VKB1_9GAMM|nr:FAD-dependent oxidoreductase [Aestuariirhabdus litorea]RRJ82747.1 FAD-dependent oxidoreductase [Aestuariirhabdus litorea]RWW92908.1 FAD-dependent oxidoreductase [Endozoicomonadaceae bacterium GTF-13]